MKQSQKFSSLIGLGILAALSAAAPASAATAEERAKCEKMVKEMGAAAPHDHGKEKGGAPSAMTAEHQRCQEILGQHGGKKEETKTKN